MPTIETLNLIAEQLNIYIGIFLLFIGDVSGLFNIILFRQKAFLKSSCSFYLSLASVADLFLLNIVLSTRILQYGFQINLMSGSIIICKVRYYISDVSCLCSLTFFILASTDRYMSTCHQAKQRQRFHFSTHRKVVLLIISITTFWLLAVSHRLVYYDIYKTSNTTQTCMSQPGIYTYYDTYFEALFVGLLPPIFICIFGLIILHNIKCVIRRQIGPADQNNTRLSRIQYIDQQLTFMLLLQTVIAMISFIPYSIQLLYSLITEQQYKSAERLAWENLIIHIIRLLSYSYYCFSFYVYLKSSETFRKQFIQIFKSSVKENFELKTIIHP
ncbi:unnamed protein product, partial [Didymodactylos carnosus]